MRRIIIIFASLAVATSAFAETSPDAVRLFREGVKKYDKGQYAEGLALFTSASTNLLDETKISTAMIQYNIGIGHYRLSQPEEAGKAFQSALKSTDIGLQGRAYFNLGNAQYQIASGSLDQGDILKAFKGFQAAQTNFMNALRIVSDDTDAKVNYELSLLAQYRILEMVAMAMSRVQQGQQMVDQYRFIEAARWFQEQKPLMEKALEVEPEKKKLFETMAERSAGVAEILATPSQGGTP